MGTGEFNAGVTCQISDKYPNPFYMAFLWEKKILACSSVGMNGKLK